MIQQKKVAHTNLRTHSLKCPFRCLDKIGKDEKYNPLPKRRSNDYSDADTKCLIWMDCNPSGMNKSDIACSFDKRCGAGGQKISIAWNQPI